MVSVTNGDLLEQEVEVIVNSVGVPISKGFGGIISNNILKETGDRIIDEAIDEAKRLFKTESFRVGEYVTTSAGKSKRIKHIVHCYCPAFVDKDSQKILTEQITNVLIFCDKNKVESIAFPPLSSGILGFPVMNCAQAFFNGVMNFLDKDLKTTLKKLKIVVYEKDKHEAFLKEWSK
jgi:O-acetyl-ADP-ribose deacetylase (regulator of RNase III)